MIKIGNLIIMNVNEHLTLEDIYTVVPSFRTAVEQTEKAAHKEHLKARKLGEKAANLERQASTIYAEGVVSAKTAVRLMKVVKKIRRIGNDAV